MRALLVICHPVPDSLSRHLAAGALAAAEAAGHEVEVLDLPAENFDPRLTAEERGGYYADTAQMPDPRLQPMAEQLRRTELLILVFPTWWFGFPAILKGWFDRVWRPGIAFDHSPDRGRLVPRLDQMRHVVAITTMGSPRWVDWLVLRQPLRRVLRWSILAPCAPKAKLHWLALHQAETAGQREVYAFVARIRRTITTIKP
jgi:putative NADPH-quinone reductase